MVLESVTEHDFNVVAASRFAVFITGLCDNVVLS